MIVNKVMLWSEGVKFHQEECIYWSVEHFWRTHRSLQCSSHVLAMAGLQNNLLTKICKYSSILKARARPERCASQLIALMPCRVSRSCPGACRTPRSDTTAGGGSSAGWTGTDTFRPAQPTRSPWARWARSSTPTRTASSPYGSAPELRSGLPCEMS